MRVEAAVGVHARIQQQANIVAMRKNLVDEAPAELAEFFFAFRIPEKILPGFADGNVGVHAAAVHADNRLRQEAGRETHLRGDLTAN